MELHVVSSFFYLLFLPTMYKKFFLHTNFFLIYRENNFCRLSIMLLNVSLTRALKYRKKLYFCES